MHESKYHGASSRQPPRHRRDVDSVGAPDSLVDFAQAPATGKPCAVMFWGKYAKGDYRTMVHVSYLMRALPELQALRSA